MRAAVDFFARPVAVPAGMFPISNDSIYFQPKLQNSHVSQRANIVEIVYFPPKIDVEIENGKYRGIPRSPPKLINGLRTTADASKVRAFTIKLQAF